MAAILPLEPLSRVVFAYGTLSVVRPPDCYAIRVNDPVPMGRAARIIALLAPSWELCTWLV
ncbi:hypothetical protein [Nocardia xishanensis]|uniref:hypothetical protein n=1 Tax=Nocardia xishanensis TaxID=238964 RepID=UPI000831FAA3|nr:hypothetical protein [Nocardia xishanensis]